MKKTTILAVTLLFLLFFNQISAREEIQTKNENYYWFCIKVKKVFEKETNRYITGVEHIYKNVQTGTFAEFAESYKKNLKKNKLCIGPFTTKELTELAVKSYSISDVKEEQTNKNFENIEFYYYFVEPQFVENPKNLYFSRIPASVASGTNKDFNDFLIEGFSHQLLAIGPFDSRLLAEKSKYISRKYGEFNDNGPKFENKISTEIQNMAEKFNSLEPYISFLQINKNTGTVKCTLNIDFPPNYFEVQMLQVISFGYFTDERIISLTDGLTIQGETFSDNNPVIGYENGGKISYQLELPFHENQKNQIMVKSTILNNREMIECKETTIDVVLK